MSLSYTSTREALIRMDLSLSNITKSYASREVLHNISLSVKEGEVVGLLGPNGAGKSTLMKCILGTVNYSGTITAPPRHGFLPENNPLYPDMYVREYLHFMDSIDTATADIETLISRVGLTPVASKRIGELSKGYRQRVGLAQALLNDPQLLILDEPTTGLDPIQLEPIRALIRELGQDRIVLLSTHIMQEVTAMCTRVVIINDGRIYLDKPIADIPNLEQQFNNLTINGRF